MYRHQLPAAVFLVLLSCGAHAQAWPTKPVRFILPVAAGSSSDVIARIVGQKLSERLGQQVILDNQPGAGGNVGIPAAARAAPDGYTMVLLSSAQAISPSIYRKLPYDLARDFVPVTQLAAGLYMLMVHPSVPARSVKELVTVARARPGQLAFGSAGTGTGTHLTGELFKAMAGVNLLHVPYRGMGPAITELLGGQISMAFLGLPSGIEHSKTGRLRALAVSTSTRSTAVPELPTLVEAGVPGFHVTTWQGLAFPAATPRDVVAKLHAETVRALQAPDLRERFRALGVDVVGDTPEQFSAYLKTEIAQWARAVREAGMTPE